MGTGVGWIAVQGMSEERAVEVLGLAPAPAGVKRACSCHTAKSWLIISSPDFGFPTPERMAGLSVDGTAIAVSADDRIMFSVVRGYEHGEARFAIEHDGGQLGSRHIAVAGKVPAEWDSILQQANRRQDEGDQQDAGVDFLFDAPIELADALCGYRHDTAWPPGKGPQFRFYVEMRKPGVLGRLFGRR